MHPYIIADAYDHSGSAPCCNLCKENTVLGSDGLKNDMYYWSSTERNNTSIFGVQLTSSGSTKVDGLKYDRPGVSSRYVFAF